MLRLYKIFSYFKASPYEPAGNYFSVDHRRANKVVVLDDEARERVRLKQRLRRHYPGALVYGTNDLGTASQGRAKREE